MCFNIKLASYFCFSIIWLALAIYAGRLILDLELWFALLATLLLGLPLYLAATYAVTIRRIHRLSQFHHRGILHWFLNRRFLAYIGWLLWTVTFAFLLLLYLGSAKTLEWVVLFIAIPVFSFIYTLFWPIAAREYKPYIAAHKSLAWTRWCTALSMSLGYALLQIFVGENHQHVSLAVAIHEGIQNNIGMSNSVLVLETARLLSLLVELRSYALDNLYLLNGAVYLGFAFLGNLMIFYNISLALSSFMLPPSEYRRILGPIQDTDRPSKLPAQSFAITSALATVFVFFIYIPTTVYLDGWLHTNPQFVKQFHQSQTLIIETVEMIGEDYYKPGTSKQIQRAYLDSIGELDVSINELRLVSDAGFQKMAENIDDYLDWYYSLPAEYERIVALATGALEEWMAKTLQVHLMRGNAFGPVQESIDQAFRMNEQLQVEHLKKVDQILIENRLQPKTAQLDIIKQSSLVAMQEPPNHSVIVNMENRILISGSMGTAGAITGVIAGKITAKVATKGAIKLGAQALAKVTAAKVAGALGGTATGAATGAAVGSIFPGIGTAIGATLGGVVGGVTIGLTVEKLLLMLEETFSREEFKQQILESIEESRLEFNEVLEPTSP